MFGITLRLINLNKGYNSDEVWLLRLSKLPLNEAVSSLKTSPSMYPVLSIFLTHIWNKINNDSELWHRLYFVLFGIGFIIIMYLTARVIFINKAAALLILSLSALSPLLIWSSQFIRGYIDSAFWATLASYFLLKSLKKGRMDKSDVICYVSTSVLALYSSYINISILILHVLFVFIYYKNDSRLIKKITLSLALIIILFLPGLLLGISQMKYAPAISSVWSERGFRLLNLNVGFFVRSILAAFGFEPLFLNIMPFQQSADRLILICISIACTLLFILLIAIAFMYKEMKKEPNKIFYFFPFATITYITLNIVAVQFLHFPFSMKYLIFTNASFIFVLVMSLASIRKNIIRATVVVFFVVLYLSRLTEAVSPEFDTKKSFEYIRDNISNQTLIVMIRNTNYYLNGTNFPKLVLNDYLIKDKNTLDYKSFIQSFKELFTALGKNYNSIWFYKCYGNDEILGANRLASDWFKNQNYKLSKVTHFKRIDVIEYTKENK